MDPPKTPPLRALREILGSTMSRTVVIADLGMGNVGSLRNMLSKLGVPASVEHAPDQIAAADVLMLPGVGSFDAAMAEMKTRGVGDAVVDRDRTSGGPLLGICLGMQLLLSSSEEGQAEGLGLIPGRCVRIPGRVGSERLRVPHMGWNTVDRVGAGPQLPHLGDGARYYFVHSYVAEPLDPAHLLGVSIYGSAFAAAIARGNVVGLQFHPEKSHRHGMRLLGEFCSQAGVLPQ